MPGDQEYFTLPAQPVGILREGTAEEGTTI